MEDNKDLIVVDDGGIRGELVSITNQYCSFKPNTKEEKAVLFKAMNNPEKRLADCINMTINVKDIYVETVTIVDQNSGEIIPVPRIVLIDVEGIGYQCVSKGVFGALKKLISLFGEPTWDEGISITVRSVKTRNGNNSVLTFDIE